MKLLDNLVIFGGVLRRAGFSVPSGRLAELVEALTWVDLGARDEVYHACRALLVHRHDQMAIFDAAFAAFWRAHHEGHAARPPRGTQSGEPRATVVQLEDVLAPGALDSPDAAASRPQRGVQVW